MNGIDLYIGIGVFVAVALALRRHKRDHQKELAPVLAAHGLTLVSAK